jgi:hypothetical protein
MWNFTGKAVIKPIVENVKSLFDNSKTASESQKELKDVTVEDVIMLGKVYS